MKMKLLKLNNIVNDITPHDRPFYTLDVQLTRDFEEADYILMDPRPSVYIHQLPFLKKYLDKCVVWVNDDNPDFLDDSDGVKYKFIAQPSGKKLKYECVPLIMTDHYKWHLDEKFIEKCRNQEKIYDYCFMGQVYGKRTVLKNLELDNYLFKETGSIYVMDDKNKHKNIEKFLLELSRCKFSFTPRGTGSNSFRLYESLMVGTVPISTDVIEYPFENEVDWDTFTIRGKMEEIQGLIDKSKVIDYQEFRDKGTRFFDEFVRMDSLYKKINDFLCQE